MLINVMDQLIDLKTSYQKRGGVSKLIGNRSLLIALSIIYY